MLDLVSYLRRICNADANETFDPTTDSLEALRDFIASTLGFGPGVSLWMFGRCAVDMPASQTEIQTDNLGDQVPDDVFNDEFYITVIHNADAPGTAPEGEWRRIADYVGATQMFTTDAFSADVEEGDLLLIVHESIIAGQPQARGTLTTSSATVPVDNTRTEANDYFNGHLLVPTEGACAGRATRIVDYDGATGTFTLDPNNPLPAASGLVDYVIIKAQADFVPPADGIVNRTPGEVIGNKTDTGITASTNTASIIRYLKGIMDSLLGYQGATSLAAKLTAARAALLDNLARTTEGKTQVMQVAVTSAANAGDVVLATVNAQEVLVKKVNVRSNGATTVDLTDIGVYAGAGKVVTLIDNVTGVRANIAAEDQQVGNSPDGGVALSPTKTIVITLTGGAATPVDLTVTIEYEACVAGGVLV